MGQTYYDSTLSDEQIQAALDAIDGLIAPANNGKAIAVDNGKLVARSVTWGGGYPEPTGTITLNSNGLHDVKDYAQALVDVSGGGAVVQPLNATENGIYNPPSGVDGYAPVTVNVSGGSSSSIFGDCVMTEYWGNIKNYSFLSSGYYAVIAGYDGGRSAEISFTVSGATVIDSDNKTSVSGDYGSAAFAVILQASAGDSISVSTVGSVARQYMRVIFLTSRIKEISNIILRVAKDNVLSYEVDSPTKQYLFYAAGATGNSNVTVNLNTDNHSDLDETQTNPPQKHIFGAVDGNSPVTIYVSGTSYSTNYIVIFEVSA